MLVFAGDRELNPIFAKVEIMIPTEFSRAGFGPK